MKKIPLAGYGIALFPVGLAVAITCIVYPSAWFLGIYSFSCGALFCGIVVAMVSEFVINK